MTSLAQAQAQALADQRGRRNSLGFAKAPGDTRIVVAMSGGVDSSVVAALLAREGYDVIGVTLQLYDHGASKLRRGACCAGQDIHDARDVAAKLGVPHYVLDYEDRFHEKVIADFARSYAKGETPVPCVSCNQRIKFADLLQTASELGADALATGHYVRASHDESGPRLYRATDPRRDQSYFLFATTRDQLARLRFPLGDLTKAEVRDLAHEFDLDVATKHDSQDICFVPSGRYAEVVEQMQPEATRPGDIVHIDGRRLGRHDGIFRFTVGQRKGLKLAGARDRATEPLYVIAIDAADHRVIVGPRTALATRRIVVRDVNWIGDAPGDASADGIEAAARVRSTRPPVPARLRWRDGEIEVELAADEQGVAPGQACVFYASTETDARVLGGGFIKKGSLGADAFAGAKKA